MIKCHLCEKEVKNNSGGQLTKHLADAHKSTLKDWTIFTKYSGIPPKCACGFCDETPVFYRNKFRKYAFEHNTLKISRALYVRKFGFPTCKECGTVTGFKNKRSEPIRFCSFVCSGSKFGFSMASTQDKIQKSVRKKYDVDNVGQLPKVKKLNSIRLKENWKNGKIIMDENWRNNIGKATTKMWKDDNYVKKVLTGIIRGLNKKSSKLHLVIREKLGLENLGFRSEVVVGRYIVDELHERKKIAVEIFGDYVHANPNRYKPNDFIKLPGSLYSAKEKWDKDKKKIEYLKLQGYNVVIIWESDDLKNVNCKLKALLCQM